MTDYDRMMGDKFEYSIDKDIPVPNWVSSRSYPFADMKVGDSFEAVPAGEQHDLSRKALRERVSSAAHRYGRRFGRSFRVLTLEDKSVRCWRIE